MLDVVYPSKSCNRLKRPAPACVAETRERHTRWPGSHPSCEDSKTGTLWRQVTPPERRSLGRKAVREAPP